MRPSLRLFRNVLPFVVSAGVLTFLLSRIDLGGVLASLSPSVLTLLLPALLVYGAVSLWVEATTLGRLAAHSGASVDLSTCARIKGASYPLSMINYALGAATLSILLRRRAGLPVADAAGVVLLIAIADLAILLGLTTAGALLLAVHAPALQGGVVAGAVLSIVLGFVLIRTSRSLGPLDRLRSFGFLAPLREAPLSLLLELAWLRLLFVVAFIALVWAALAAFDVDLPLGDLVVNVAAVTLVAALPIAISGLGTGQMAFVYLFGHWAEADVLLACSLVLSMGLIFMRVGLGLIFSREFTREAIAAVRGGDS